MPRKEVKYKAQCREHEDCEIHLICNHAIPHAYFEEHCKDNGCFSHEFGEANSCSIVKVVEEPDESPYRYPDDTAHVGSE